MTTPDTLTLTLTTADAASMVDYLDLQNDDLREMLHEPQHFDGYDDPDAARAHWQGLLAAGPQPLR